VKLTWTNLKTGLLSHLVTTLPGLSQEWLFMLSLIEKERGQEKKRERERTWERTKRERNEGARKRKREKT